MPVLQGAVRVVPYPVADLPRFTDLIYRDTPSGPVLYACTQYTSGQITAASSSEPGLTRLNFAIDVGGTVRAGPATGGHTGGTGWGDLLVGSAGNDTLEGGGGADVLMDGAGRDQLEGGTGADIFVMAADGQPDRIADFTPGQDRLDLSGWGMLRNLSQLTMAATATGLTIRFGSEVLTVDSATGAPIPPPSCGWPT